MEISGKATDLLIDVVTSVAQCGHPSYSAKAAGEAIRALEEYLAYLEANQHL